MPDTVDFLEIGSPNPAASQAFYGGLFGWEFSDPTPAAYWYVNSGEGGLWDTSSPSGAVSTTDAAYGVTCSSGSCESHDSRSIWM